MKLNKKGMTLFELLAVIVILGIIAAIAFPTVGGLINDTKKDTFASNANAFVNYSIAQAQAAYTTDDDGSGSAITYVYTIGTPVAQGTDSLTGAVSLTNEFSSTKSPFTGGAINAYVIITITDGVADVTAILYSDGVNAITAVTTGDVPFTKGNVGDAPAA